MDSPGSPFNPVIPRGPATPVMIFIERVKTYQTLTEKGVSNPVYVLSTVQITWEHKLDRFIRGALPHLLSPSLEINGASYIFMNWMWFSCYQNIQEIFAILQKTAELSRGNIH